MSFLKAMQQRYTVKKYDSTKKIDTDKIEELKEILRLSPSSINSQPWQFTFVSDDKVKNELAKASQHNEQKVNDAHAVVVFNTINSISLFEAQIAEHLPEGAVNYYNQYVKGQPEEATKMWFHKQVYLALGVFLSACAEMGIDSTPMEGIEPEKYDAILGQTDYNAIVAVAIGCKHPDDFNKVTKKPKSRMPLEKVVKMI